ncbi:MAG: carboxypeptidase regulatory-like domain-containing protein, partial [Solirubrobacterales bacterium]|nr:carboxypeptidase regulatory-like domain-containing protein [Solirubrobacterales bacterium]
ESWEPARTRALVVALVLLVAATFTLAPQARADQTSYPVRLCSPQNYDANGYPHGTFSPGLGAGTRVYKKAANGTVSYDNVTLGSISWTIWDAAIPCGAQNANNTGTSSYGFKLFKPGTGVFYKGEEGGLELSAPNGEEIQQLGVAGRSLQPTDPYSSQGGISNGGTKLKMEFLNPSGASSLTIPTQNYARLTIGAPVAQHSTRVRLGLLCDPNPTATVCIGGAGETVLLNNLILTLGDPTRPTVTVGSTPLTEGNWVSGTQQVTFTARDQQSGLRETYVYLDNQQVSKKTYSCATVSGEFSGGFTGTMASQYKPCPQDPQTETVSIDTTRFGDGIHQVKVCARDFARWSPYWNNDQMGPETCSDNVQVRIDNSAPAAPEAAEAINTRVPRSVNPYDVSWNDPGAGDQGSPIHEVRYEIVNQTGNQVVSTTTVDNGSNSNAPANSDQANNIEHVPTLQTPLAQGEFKLQMRLVDSVGHVSKATEVPLSYSCDNSGGTPLPQADIAMGLVEPGQNTETATEFLALGQGERSTVVGKVRGPGQMPINGADVCINAKPVVDPQLQLLTSVDTNGNGNYSSALPPGPSRNMLTVFRQGHRETWSDPVSTQVTVSPTLSTTLKGDGTKFYKKQTKAVVRTGKMTWFKGIIPGPYADEVVVVLQGKPAGSSDKKYRAFRRYRTRFGGRFKMRNVFFNTSKTGRKAYLTIRAQVRNQVGYPYNEGDSDEMTLVVLPKKKKKAVAGKGRHTASRR